MNKGDKVRVVRQFTDDRFFHRYFVFNYQQFDEQIIANAVGTVYYDDGGYGLCVIWQDKRMPELIPRKYIEKIF